MIKKFINELKNTLFWVCIVHKINFRLGEVVGVVGEKGMRSEHCTECMSEIACLEYKDHRYMYR